MDRRKELSATEKLLDLIRAGDDPTRPPREDTAAPRSPSRDQVGEASPIGRQRSSAVPAMRAAVSSAWSRLAAGVPAVGSRRNQVTVGVALRPGAVEVAVVGQLRGRQLLQDHLTYKVEQEGGGAADPDKTWLDSPALKATLRRALEVVRAGQTGRARRLEIWAKLSWRHVEVHLLDIPQVAQSEVANAVFWAARKNIEGFDPKEQILDFVLSPRSRDDDKQRVVVFLAARRQVERLRGLFRSISFPLAGITAPAVAVSNLAEQERLAGRARVFSHLRLEEQNAFISLYEENGLVFSRDIKTGLQSILEEEPAAAGRADDGGRQERQPPALSPDFKQQPVFDLGLESPAGVEPANPADEIEFSLDDESQSSDGPAEQDSQLVLALELDGDEEPEGKRGAQLQGPGAGADDAAQPDIQPDAELDDVVEPPAEPPAEPPVDPQPEPAFDPQSLTRLLRQLERTFHYCRTNLDIARPEQLYVSSPVRLGPALLARMEEELGIGCAWLDPFANDQGIGVAAVAPPTGNYQRQLLAPAVGLAFSDRSRSQNFLLTYPDKEKQKVAYRANQVIISFFIALALGLTGLYFWQQADIDELRTDYQALEDQRRQLAATQYDEPYLAALAAEIKRQQGEITVLARRQQLLLLLTEAQQLLPDGVTLQHLRASVGENDRQTDKVQLEVRGVVTGRSAERELQLARYLRRLEASEQIRAARIVERREWETPATEQVLSFTLKVEALQLAVNGGKSD